MAPVASRSATTGRCSAMPTSISPTKAASHPSPPRSAASSARRERCARTWPTRFSASRASSTTCACPPCCTAGCCARRPSAQRSQPGHRWPSASCRRACAAGPMAASSRWLRRASARPMRWPSGCAARCAGAPARRCPTGARCRLSCAPRRTTPRWLCSAAIPARRQAAGSSAPNISSPISPTLRLRRRARSPAGTARCSRSGPTARASTTCATTWCWRWPARNKRWPRTPSSSTTSKARAAMATTAPTTWPSMRC